MQTSSKPSGKTSNQKHVGFSFNMFKVYIIYHSKQLFPHLNMTKFGWFVGSPTGNQPFISGAASWISADHHSDHLVSQSPLSGLQGRAPWPSSKAQWWLMGCNPTANSSCRICRWERLKMCLFPIENSVIDSGKLLEIPLEDPQLYDAMFTYVFSQIQTVANSFVLHTITSRETNLNNWMCPQVVGSSYWSENKGSCHPQRNTCNHWPASTIELWWHPFSYEYDEVLTPANWSLDIRRLYEVLMKLY